MKLSKKTPIVTALAILCHGLTLGQTSNNSKDLGTIVVKFGATSSLPTQIPSAMESVTATQIQETINATDSEDAIKYLPSLSLRKRYTGDYNHTVLMSRTSGTGNSARTAVFADGILISNYLGNGATYAPRWGMVTPEEIERVDVMYGPFSVAYGGNSVGGVVDYVTKMPSSLEKHMKVSAFSYEHDNYGVHDTYGGSQESASIGNKVGDFSYWINFNRTHSKSHPLGYVNVNPTACTVTNCNAPRQVNGIFYTQDKYNATLGILGATTAYDTTQDHAKFKVAYEIEPTLRATYTMGYWENTSHSSSNSFMTQNGTPYFGSTGGYVNDGTSYYKIPTGVSGFYESQDNLKHYMHNLSLKTNTQEYFDWEVAASVFEYQKDDSRYTGTNSATQLYTGVGTLADGAGSGWNNLSFKGVLRPDGIKGAHIYDFGLQLDEYTLKTITSNTSTDWLNGSPSSTASFAGGKTTMQSIYIQDAWKFADGWKSVVGLRAEDWVAKGGYVGTTGPVTNYKERHEFNLSPKASISTKLNDNDVFKTSIAKSLRMPTPQELYGNTSVASNAFVNDPNLKPEANVTIESSVERDYGNAFLRGSVFYENTENAIYSQKGDANSLYPYTSYVQNIDRVESKGVEVYYVGNDVLLKGLDISGSVTYTESIIKENKGYVTAAGDTIGKNYPRIPDWRATVIGNYHWSHRLNTSLGARCSGKQYTSLNNADVNGYAYSGASEFFVVDVRARYMVDKEWSISAGVDNLNNYQYWNYHLYPGRTYFAELKYDFK
jgi:iron complex outermembrane receptor protein